MLPQKLNLGKQWCTTHNLKAISQHASGDLDTIDWNKICLEGLAKEEALLIPCDMEGMGHLEVSPVNILSLTLFAQLQHCMWGCLNSP